MRTMQNTAILLLLSLSLLAMNACQWGTVPSQESGTQAGNENTATVTTVTDAENETTRSQALLALQKEDAVFVAVDELISLYQLDAGLVRLPSYSGMVVGHVISDDATVYSLSPSCWAVITYVKDSANRQYCMHLILQEGEGTQQCPIYWGDKILEASGAYIFTSENSATADTSRLKPGASVRSLLDSFPELGLYCKVDDRFPFTVSGDVYAGPAVLMVNEGFFLITTELSADGTDVLIKEVTKQDMLTYQDLCQLYGG